MPGAARPCRGGKQHVVQEERGRIQIRPCQARRPWLFAMSLMCSDDLVGKPSRAVSVTTSRLAVLVCSHTYIALVRLLHASATINPTLDWIRLFPRAVCSIRMLDI